MVVVKIGVKIVEIEKKLNIQMISKGKSCSSGEKMVWLISSKTDQRQRNSINVIRNDKGDMTTDATGSNVLIRTYRKERSIAIYPN